jgi:hypothetical protein
VNGPCRAATRTRDSGAPRCLAKVEALPEPGSMLAIAALLVALSLAAPAGAGKRARSTGALVLGSTTASKGTSAVRAGARLLPRKPPRRHVRRLYRVWRFPAPSLEAPLPLPPSPPEDTVLAAAAATGEVPSEVAALDPVAGSPAARLLLSALDGTCEGTLGSPPARDGWSDAWETAVEAVVYAATPIEAITVALGRGVVALGRGLAGWPRILAVRARLEGPAPDSCAAVPALLDAPGQAATAPDAATPAPAPLLPRTPNAQTFAPDAALPTDQAEDADDPDEESAAAESAAGPDPFPGD